MTKALKDITEKQELLIVQQKITNTQMQNQHSQEIIRRQEERQEEIKQHATERRQDQDAIMARIAAMFQQRLLMAISTATPN